MRRQLWDDAWHLARAARLAPTRQTAWRMAKTDAYWLLVLFRLRQAARSWGVPVANRMLRLIQMMCGGVELGNDITLGHGVYFIHSLGTVVGGTARIGNRVRFMGCNTVGTARDNGCPIIGDDVEVGCGARILGPVHIGAGAVIGANAVVLSDVPAGAVVVGAPARVVKMRETGRPGPALAVGGRS